MKNIELNIASSRLDINKSETILGLDLSKDLLVEEILENMNSTPLGLVLKQIASMPEIRQKKVLNIRQQICTGNYNENSYLDEVLDKVLNDI